MKGGLMYHRIYSGAPGPASMCPNKMYTNVKGSKAKIKSLKCHKCKTACLKRTNKKLSNSIYIVISGRFIFLMQAIVL